MRRFAAFILAVLMLFSLAACGAPADGPDGAGPEPAPGEDIPGPEPEEVVPEPVPDEPSPVFEALNGFDRVGELREVRPVDSERALIMYGTVSDEEETEGYYFLKLALFDTGKDEVLNETTVEGGYDEVLIGVRKNGEILTFNWYRRELSVYRADLSFDRVVPMPEDWPGLDLYFDREGDRLYYSSRNMLYEMPADGGDGTLSATFEEDCFIYAFDPASGKAACLKPYEEDKAFRELMVCNAADGSTVLTAATGADQIFMHDGMMAMSTARTLPDAGGRSVSFHYVAAIYDLDSASAKAIDLGSKAKMSWDANSIPYVSGLDCSSDETAKPMLIDLAAGKKAVLPIDEDGVFDLKHCYFRETERCLIAANIYKDEDLGPNGMGHIRLFSADTSGLEFSETLRDEEPDSEEGNRRQRDENRQILRKIADGIEEDFHVTVMFGDECLDVENFGTHDYSSTEEGSVDQSDIVYRMLSNIRENLSLYPEGFFDTFYDEEGEGGLKILLVLHPQDLFNPGFPLGGYTYQVYSTYYIVVDAMMYSPVEAIVPHEMWHAVEQRIWNDYAGAFDTYTWSEEYNPPDFEDYVYDLSVYEAESDKWDRYIMQTGGEDPYFFRSYSLVNDKEDRATLIETLYNKSLGETPADSAEALREYPHLRAKLDFMAEQVRSVFGTVYWENDG